jgi:hypothetical protein
MRKERGNKEGQRLFWEVTFISLCVTFVVLGMSVSDIPETASMIWRESKKFLVFPSSFLDVFVRASYGMCEMEDKYMRLFDN